MGKDLNKYLIKEDIQMVNEQWKVAQYHLSLRNCKLRQQDYATYQLE